MKRRDFCRYAALTTVGATLGASLPLQWAHAGAMPPDPFYAHGFPDLQGRQVELTQYLGKPLVLNFWASWCAPCVKEMPDLEHLHSKYQGVHIVGLAVDTQVNIQKFNQKVQVSYPLLIAGHGGIQLMRALGNKKGGLPFTVIFDEKGQIVTQILGQIKPDELDAYIKNMI